jgi:hypothetical protein
VFCTWMAPNCPMLLSVPMSLHRRSFTKLPQRRLVADWIRRAKPASNSQSPTSSPGLRSEILLCNDACYTDASYERHLDVNRHANTAITRSPPWSVTHNIKQKFSMSAPIKDTFSCEIRLVCNPASWASMQQSGFRLRNTIRKLADRLWI